MWKTGLRLGMDRKLLTLWSCTLVAGLGLVAGAVADQPSRRVVDGFSDVSAWRTITTEGVSAEIESLTESCGSALRLRVKFEQGAGFCVLRRDLSLDLPANYRFDFAARGRGNISGLEFKLIDESGENVWWVNRRGFELPDKWESVGQRKRDITFAWGPGGADQPLNKVGAIEFAVVAGGDREVVIDLDELVLTTLPVAEPLRHPPSLSFSSVHADASPASALNDAGAVEWHSTADDKHPTLTVHFGQYHEFGGLRIDWSNNYATTYRVETSHDGADWTSVAEVVAGNGGRDYIETPDGSGQQVRVVVAKASSTQGVGIESLRVLPPTFGDSANAMFAQIAKDSPVGCYPAYFIDRQQPWTVVGVDGDRKEALLDAGGALEMDKANGRIEPFVVVDGNLHTWADVRCTQSLAEGHLPIPSVTWHGDGWRLVTTALAEGEPGSSWVAVRYRLTADDERPVTGRLYVAARPFQVLPTWQNLNVTGGAVEIGRIAWDGRRLCVDEGRAIEPNPKPVDVGATSIGQGEIIEHIARGDLPSAADVDDPRRLASAAMAFDFLLEPGASHDVVVRYPLHDSLPDDGWHETAPAAWFAKLHDRVCKAWSAKLNRVEFELPPACDELVNTFRATQAYILINADGPGIQPGSRTYERSWIRDGALTSTALLYAGHNARVRRYLDWYATHIYDSGMVPCVVDQRGADPFPEHDSTGQYIYLVAKLYRFTRDRDILEHHLPHVMAGVDYLERLRAQRLTPEFCEGPIEKRMLCGMVPESASHEGYLANPMHSYWDGFFVICGYKDAADIARWLGRDELAERYDGLVAAYRKAMYHSIGLSMKHHNIRYIPGCAELGDFDATSTAIGIAPCGELAHMPDDATRETFDRYYKYFCDRRDGRIEWRDYTPYELRLVGTFVRLGQPERAHALLDFFLADQEPTGWKQWPEVGRRDRTVPHFVGDIPHTWVGSEFVRSFRSLFVYERPADSSLVLAAGVPQSWQQAERGVRIMDWPTAYGKLSYRLWRDGDRIAFDVSIDGELPEGGLVLQSPGITAIESIKSHAGSTPVSVDGGLRVHDARWSGTIRLR